MSKLLNVGHIWPVMFYLTLFLAVLLCGYMMSLHVQDGRRVRSINRNHYGRR